MLIHHPQSQHQNGTEHVVYCLSCTKCPSTVYIEETGCRLAVRFREHRRDVINGRNDLPVPAHFNLTNHTLEDMKVAGGIQGRPSQPGLPKEAGDEAAWPSGLRRWVGVV